MGSYTLVIYGIGNVLGGSIIGYINDNKGGGRSVAKINIVFVIVAYGCILIANGIHKFNLFCFVATFMFGI
jgi:predicted MFS family arabinose efflux permease